jgi:hypothetical protein
MTLAATWLAAEANNGRTKADARRAMNEATGMRTTAGDVYRWETGERHPRHAEVREYMLRIAVPYLVPSIFKGRLALRKRQEETLIEALR